MAPGCGVVPRTASRIELPHIVFGVTGTAVEPTTRSVPPATSDSWFWWVVGVATVLQLAIRGWSAADGWFYWDDFWWHDIVARTSLVDTTTLSLGGHFSPLTYIPYWLLTALAPYDWGVRVVVMLVVLLLINLGVLAVAARLWTTRGPQLSVYLLWCFSTLAAPSWLWYSQFSMAGALLLVSTWTLWAYLRALDSDSTGRSVVAVVLLAAALLAQERMLAISVVLGLFLWVVVRHTLMDLKFSNRRALWASSAVVLVAYVVLYRAVASEQPTIGALDVGSSARLAFDMMRNSAIPSLLGGPWTLDGEPVLGRASVPLWLQIVAVVVMAALIAWSLRCNRGAWRAWCVLAAALALDVALVVLGRGATLGIRAIGEWRYFSDLAVIAPLLITSAFVPPGRRLSGSLARRTGLAAVVAGFVVSALVTTIPLGSRWHQSLSRPFFQSAASELQSAGPVVVMDRVVPNWVVNEVLGVQRFASRVFSIIDVEAVFDQPTTDPLWLSDDGALVPGDLSGGRQSKDLGPCGYPVVGTATTWVPLPPGIDYFDWGVRIDYRADQDVRAGVQDGSRTVIVDLPADRNAVFVPMPGVGDRLGVFLLSPDASVCVTSVRTGSATAAFG